MKVFIKEFEDMISKVRPVEKTHYGILDSYVWSRDEGFEMLTFAGLTKSWAAEIAESCRAYGIKEFAITLCDEHFFKVLAAFQEVGIFPARTAVFEWKSRPVYMKPDEKYSQIVLIMKVN